MWNPESGINQSSQQPSSPYYPQQPAAPGYYPQSGAGSSPPQPQPQAYGSYGYSYSAPPSIDKEKKNIPLGLVVTAGLLIWFLLFTSLFGYAALKPCGFVKASMSVGGGETLIKSMETCCSMTNSTVCKNIIKSMVFGETPVCVAACKSPLH